MSSFEFVSVLLLLAAMIGIVNHRYLHPPHTIGVLAGSLVLSIVIILLDRTADAVELREWWEQLVAFIDLPHVFLDGVLAFMLFTGSLHVDVDNLRTQKWTVLARADLGAITSSRRLAGGALCRRRAILVQGLSMPLLVRRLYRPRSVPR